jgi:hypothetical protein
MIIIVGDLGPFSAIGEKINQLTTKIPNGHKIYQMAVKDSRDQ